MLPVRMKFHMTNDSMFKSSKGMISHTYEFSKDSNRTMVSGDRSSKEILSFPNESRPQHSGDFTNISREQTSKETSSFPSGSGNKSSKGLISQSAHPSSSLSQERNRKSELRNLSDNQASNQNKKIVCTKVSSEEQDSGESKIRSNQNCSVLSTNNAANKTSNFGHGLKCNKNSDVMTLENVKEKPRDKSLNETMEKLEVLQVSEAKLIKTSKNCVKSSLNDVTSSVTNKDPIVISDNDDDDVYNCNEIEKSKIASGKTVLILLYSNRYALNPDWRSVHFREYTSGCFRFHVET